MAVHIKGTRLVMVMLVGLCVCVCVCVCVCACMWYACMCSLELHLFHAAFEMLSCRSVLLHGRKPCWSACVGRASWHLCPDHLKAMLKSAQGEQGPARSSSTLYTAFSHSHSDLRRTECSKACPGSICTHNLSQRIQ